MTNMNEPNTSDFCTHCDERLSDVCRACAENQVQRAFERGRRQGAREGGAVAVGLLRMADAIRNRPAFSIALCDDCARGRYLLVRTDLMRATGCQECHAIGTATPSGGAWVYA
jgi:hypothetical protein